MPGALMAAALAVPTLAPAASSAGCCGGVGLGRTRELMGFLWLLFSAVGASEPPYAPGDSNYWVKLQSIEVSEGVLEPPYREDADNTEYKLKVQRIYPTVLVMTLGLNLPMYNLMHCPRISVDGRDVTYSPLNVISVQIPLNESIGPLDRVVRIDVADPTRGNWLRHTNSRSYRIRVTQPPEYEKIVQARAIVVTDGEGQELQSRPRFTPDSIRSAYHFLLTEMQTVVHVQLDCSNMATGMRYDGKHVDRGAILTIDMARHVELNSMVGCTYYDPKWTPYEESRTYALSFSRTVKLGAHPPKLSMLQDSGYCEPRATYEAKLHRHGGNAQLTDGHEGQNVNASAGGFVCVSDRRRPMLMASYEKAAIQVYLLSRKHRAVTLLPNYLPVEVEHSHSREEFTLRQHAGLELREYPVTLIWPADCSTMACPRHYVPKGNKGHGQLVATHICLEETCSEQDLDVCCERVGRCSSLTCPMGMQPATNASEVDCSTPNCGKGDVPHCCVDQAACGTFHCPAYKVLRSGATTIFCDGKDCGDEDEDRCCEARASCSTFACPNGKVLGLAASNRLCRGSVCNPEDEVRCCQNPVKCNTLTCPPGKALRSGAAKIDCSGATCTEEDHVHCCVAASPGLKDMNARTGVVQSINDDGTYAVRYDSGKVDAHVPEWALHGGQNHSNLRPGDQVSVIQSKDGGYRHRKYCFGWVQEAHGDKTYIVKYDSGEVDKRVPSWALRAVDKRGHIFVHSELFTEGERVLASRTHQGYHKEEYAIGSVAKVNSDGTYTVRYASGAKDEHVPKWDLRAIDSQGRSYAKSRHNLGDNVEVNLGTKVKGQKTHKDQLRTKYLLGHVIGANADGTYRIHYDFGGTEDHVPVWAMRFLDATLHSSVRSRYSVHDRVEARISMDIANNLTGWGIEALGIATREKVVLYRSLNCWPAAAECGPMPPAGYVPKYPKPPKVPSLPTYDAHANPDGRELCYYDSTCSLQPGIGCSHDAARPNCRFCGFGSFPRCPKPYDCSKGFPGNWPQAQKDWCCINYNAGCPYECRWGKWWPDEANGWGPWWTEEKRAWCCRNQHIGCPDKEDKLPQIASSLFASGPEHGVAQDKKQAVEQSTVPTTPFKASLQPDNSHGSGPEQGLQERRQQSFEQSHLPVGTAGRIGTGEASGQSTGPLWRRPLWTTEDQGLQRQSSGEEQAHDRNSAFQWRQLPGASKDRGLVGQSYMGAMDRRVQQRSSPTGEEARGGDAGVQRRRPPREAQDANSTAGGLSSKYEKGRRRQTAAVETWGLRRDAAFPVAVLTSLATGFILARRLGTRKLSQQRDLAMELGQTTQKERVPLIC